MFHLILTGAIQVHKQDSSHLVLDTGNKYQVLRQENFPQDPNTWFPDSKKKVKKPVDDGGKRKKGSKRTKIPHKGYKKWSQRPEPVQVINTFPIVYCTKWHLKDLSARTHFFFASVLYTVTRFWSSVIFA